MRPTSIAAEVLYTLVPAAIDTVFSTGGCMNKRVKVVACVFSCNTYTRGEDDSVVENNYKVLYTVFSILKMNEKLLFVWF